MILRRAFNESNTEEAVAREVSIPAVVLIRGSAEGYDHRSFV